MRKPSSDLPLPRNRGLRRRSTVAAPTPAALTRLLEPIAHRVGRHLERRGLLVRDCEQSYLQWDPEFASPLDELLGHAITYRIAVGPQARSEGVRAADAASGLARAE